MRRLCLVTLVAFVLAGCAARETEIHTTGSEGSGVTDAREVSGQGASAAAGAAIGNPGR